MVLTIGCHLVLLIVLLQPVASYTGMFPVVEHHASALKLRFILSPRPTSTPSVSPAPHLVVRSPGVAQKALVKEATLLPGQHVAHVTARPTSTNVSPPPAVPVLPHVLASPDPYTNSQASTEDGGFRERLLNAQHAGDIHGVPGSDRPIVPGIQLINPMDQGIGAVARTAQRLFGVTNHHCIDVEVLKSLAPEELIARHVSVDEVNAEAEKYNCYHPLGLSF
ncbi:hypothetical protein [Dyella monticola]|nr:hypothetical protein [Dyella monticola]